MSMESTSTTKDMSYVKRFMAAGSEDAMRRYWMKDETAKECSACNLPFNILRRRHHCRICGRIFCNSCASTIISGERFGYNGSMRVCDYCKKVLDTSDSASSLLDGQSPPPTSSLKASPSTQQIAAASGNPVEMSFPVAKRVPSATVSDVAGNESPIYRMFGMGGSRSRGNNGSDIALADNASIIETTLAEDLVAAARAPSQLGSELEVPHEDDDLDRYHNRSALTAWTTTDSIVSGRGGRATPASYRPTSAMAGDFFSDDENTFELARPTSPNSRPLTREDSRRSTTRSSLKRRLRARASGSTGGGKGIPRSYSGQLDEDHYQMGTPINELHPPQPPDQGRGLGHRYRQSTSDIASIHEVVWPPASIGFMRHLLNQLLQDDGIDPSTGWADIVLNLVTTAGERLRPNVRDGDEMDIRHYLKIKTIPGGRPRESGYINGVVFSKSVAHKAMMRRVSPVRVLLLKFALEYQRDGEIRFLSLDPVLAQEREYLRNLVARIADLEPDVVLVEKAVSRLALEFLLDQNIIVAHNVKEEVLLKVARATRAQVVKSVGELSSRTVLGTCETFDVKMFPDPHLKGGHKSYLVFSGGQKELQGTIVFRGGEVELLKRIKVITNFLLYAIYNLRLESSMLRDENLVLPWIGDADPGALHPDASSGVSDGNTMIESGPEPGSPREEGAVDEFEYYDDYSTKVKDARKRFEGRVFSVTPNIRFEPPYLIGKILRELERYEDDYDEAYVSTMDVDLNMQLLNSYFSFPGLLDPLGHQNLLVLFSISSTVTRNICQEPVCQRILYYGAYPIPEAANEVPTQDVTLGGLIESLVSSASTICPTKGCGRPYLDHIRRYSHGNGRVSITLRKRSAPPPGHRDGILMWNSCRMCDKETVPTPMSNEASRYSFGKFLELMFYARGIHLSMDSCEHDPTKDRLFSFAKGDVVIVFEYDDVLLWEVTPPPLRTSWNMRKLSQNKQGDYNALHQAITRYYDSMAERVKMTNVNDLLVGLGSKLLECKNQLSDFSRRIANEKKAMLDELLDLSHSSLDYDYLTIWSIAPKLNAKVKQWDENFDRLARTFFQPDPRELSRVAGMRYLRKVFTDRLEVAGERTFEDDTKEDHIDRTQLPKLSSSPTDREFEDGISVYSDAQSSPGTDRDDATTNTNFEDPYENGYDGGPADQISLSSSKFRLDRPTVRGRLPSLRPPSPGSMRPTYMDDDCSVSTNDTGSQVVPITRYRTVQQSSNSISSRFTKGSAIDGPLELGTPRWEPPGADMFEWNDANSDMAREPSISSQRRSLRMMEIDNRRDRDFDMTRQPHTLTSTFSGVSATAASEESAPSLGLGFGQFDDSEELQERYVDIRSTEASEFDFALGRDDDSLRCNRREKDSSETSLKDPEADRAERYEDSRPSGEFNDITGVLTTQSTNVEGVKEKMSLMKTVQALWNGSSVNWSPIDYPFAQTDHVIDSADPHDDIVYPVNIVREDEPSSIISATLASDDFQRKMESLRHSSAVHSDPEAVEEDVKGSQMSDNLEDEIDFEVQIEKVLRRKSPGHHLRYQSAQGAAKFWCNAFWAEQFDALRAICGCDLDQFIQSLSRCVKWESVGGKSGSAFLKTRDDRFILKELSRPEMNAFIKFAPEYFTFMADAIFENLPTMLAKIYGVYRIGFTNTTTGKSFKMELLVMENLFYNRNLSKLFDLKGSIRNRHVQATGRGGEVLLDENLIELSRENPMLIRPHAYRLLKTGVWNDCLFLGKHNVMDYSLLVGVDEENQELVVGIVDFIRTYTWDKRLETWVKETGLLGGTGLTPTIVTPKQYKRRFRDAMMRYFQMVPDKWHWWEKARKEDRPADGDGD
ncbi:hypothetical protein M427DRAFT_119374 [Gonapodya prolifera JEL478]|uniref:1-phosphatidylinositol-3-phosphate 5-kinase n=1 Tax=Gonapodya prolifera (strain JEL478) TaxID=1344416 RepID=A0A139AWJ0_GONPJ|nr:hypothetical protein M427DRAFT_119374 [Gonapodya prolifera JEL478]|eukprot:KXS20835.1 hypothetical protein M427DRAFT_119374 [Gonapodya prolifera JEL478]